LGVLAAFAGLLLVAVAAAPCYLFKKFAFGGDD